MGNAPKVIDLYSGVGGLSLSAEKAGFKVAAAVEVEKRIIEAHQINFPKSVHICSDVSTLTGKSLREKSKINGAELCGLIGGPPCQGFSPIGKRNVNDKRNHLFIHFFKLVSSLKPVFYLAENVPGILDNQYNQIRVDAINIIKKDYDILEPLKISANHLGAPTVRTRIFFIGVRKGVADIEKLNEELIGLSANDIVYVKDALEGLPFDISDTWLDYKSSWRRLSTTTPNKYVDSINDIILGVGDEDAISRFLFKNEVSGCFGTRHSSEIVARYSTLNSGQQDKISKSKKLDPNGFCPTLRSGTDSTRGSFQAVRPIHPYLPRVITPREAARLQGFPDWFQFHKTKWHSFRMIGNSVCPVVATKILKTIRNALNM